MRRRLSILLISCGCMLGPSCEDQPVVPTDVQDVEVLLSNEGPAQPGIARFIRRLSDMPSSTPAEAMSFRSAEGSAAIDEAQIVVLDFTRWDNDAAALNALDTEPDSLYNTARFDIRRDIWDNLVAAFKAYRGSSYRFAGHYPLAIRNGAARGIIAAPPGLNLFFATLRSNKKTVYLYSALTLVVPGIKSPIVLTETTAEGAALNNIALWTGDAWVPVAGGMNGPVFALTTDGQRLYAGGRFSLAGTAQAPNVASFDGAAWRSLGSGTNDSVSALAVGGSVLYAGGSFTRAGGLTATGIAAWNGSGWLPVGSGTNGPVRTIFADTSSVVVGGEFTTAGGISASNIARWDGSGWTAFGSGTNGSVRSVIVLPGNGAVVAGGEFSRAGVSLSNAIAAFSASTWAPLAGGVGSALGSVGSLILFGNELHAGGRFSSIGGITADNIAVWNGTAWLAVGNGLSGGSVNALATDGTVLVAGGSFTRSGAVPIASVAARVGTSWLPLKNGLDGPVHAVVFYKGALVVGGEFGRAR